MDTESQRCWCCGNHKVGEIIDFDPEDGGDICFLCCEIVDYIEASIENNFPVSISLPHDILYPYTEDGELVMVEILKDSNEKARKIAERISSRFSINVDVKQHVDMYASGPADVHSIICIPDLSCRGVKVAR